MLPELAGPAWDGVKVGAGPPPIFTEHGWMLIYHGVKAYGGHLVYRAGVSLLDNYAFVIGGPLWQPTGGIVDGALQFDGIDDCVITGPVLNPADGTFSAFAWIKGGAPGQAVLSQTGNVSWLCMDSVEGCLMTELKDTRGGSLLSQTVITDGNWHQIVFVWDGSHRTLYVDDVAVAEDAQNGLEGSTNGLYIGTGEMMQPGTYFSGLIDEIRIYNRAVSP